MYNAFIMIYKVILSLLETGTLSIYYLLGGESTTLCTGFKLKTHVNNERSDNSQFSIAARYDSTMCHLPRSLW